MTRPGRSRRMETPGSCGSKASALFTAGTGAGGLLRTLAANVIAPNPLVRPPSPYRLKTGDTRAADSDLGGSPCLDVCVGGTTTEAFRGGVGSFGRPGGEPDHRRLPHMLSARPLSSGSSRH